MLESINMAGQSGDVILLLLLIINTQETTKYCQPVMTNEGPALDSKVLVALDLVHLMGMARRVARCDSVSLTSAPQQP